PGYFWVYAQTQGHNSTNVIDGVLVVSAGGAITQTGIPDTVVPINALTKVSPQISITIKDGNGNPLPDGSTITASIVPPPNPPPGFQVGVSGDLPAQIPNAGYARFPGPGITDFSFQVVNQSTISISGTAITINITVVAAAPYVWTSTFSFTALAQ